MGVRTNLVLIASLASIASDRVNAQGVGGGPFIITGIVIDDERAPLGSAELGFARPNEAARLVRTGADGRFTFTDIPAGYGSITVRRLGYRQRRVDLQVSAATTNQPMELILLRVASDIDPVVVDASAGHLREFYEHKKRSSFGHFIDQQEIRKRGPRFVSELFRTIPGAMVRTTSGIGNAVRLRGCRPRIWLDGVRTEDAEIDEVTTPSEVAGIEIYPSFAGTPPQYMDRENRACGTIVIWSRQ